MASGHTEHGHGDYVRGTMPIDNQSKTFDGFTRVSAFLMAFFVVVLLMPILVFTANVAWLPALIITFVIGLILGAALKLGGGWYGTLVGLGVFAFLLSLFISVVA